MRVRPAAPDAEQALAAAGYGVLLRRVLAARGCADAEAARRLLEPEQGLSDPFLLKDMDRAVARIRQAVEEEEPIVIYGDYDVDGICATAILYECLSSQGAHVRCKLPTRGGGYGLTRAALENLAAKGFSLVVTVDNGISAVEEAACARKLGLDLIVTDHHLPGAALPEAVAVVDPRRSDDASPFKSLCGAGVAFKLCAALEGCAPEELLEMYGELAALGTVADVMPLVGENRILVREGLALLQETMRPGLQALLESGGYAGRPVTADTVSYGLAPRLNAAGRMDNAAVALKLLLCGDEDQAAGIAARLAEINTERQQAEQEVFAAACRLLEQDPARLRDRVLIVAGEDWHPGVIGIVAARLMERYNRPAIAISLHEGEGRGSGRAPDPFDLHGALAACAGHLVRFGGHAAAAGLEIEEEQLPAFRAAAETGGPAAGCRRHAGGTDAGTGAAAPAAGAIRAGKSDPGIAGAGCSDRRRVGHGGRRPPHAGAFAPGQADAVCLTVRRAAAEICLPGRYAGGSGVGSFGLQRPQRPDGFGAPEGDPSGRAGQPAQRTGRLVRGALRGRCAGPAARCSAAAPARRHGGALQADPRRTGIFRRSAAGVCGARGGKRGPDAGQPDSAAGTGTH